MPDWLEIVLMITSTIIGIVFMVVVIHLRKSGNCMLLGKYINKERKSKSINHLPHNKGIKLKELNFSQKPTVSRPLSHTSTPVVKYIPELPRLTLVPIVLSPRQRKL